MEPPTSENGIMHVSVGVGVVWAVTKDRKVRRGLWGLGSRALFHVEGGVGFCSLNKSAKHCARSAWKSQMISACGTPSVCVTPPVLLAPPPPAVLSPSSHCTEAGGTCCYCLLPTGAPGVWTSGKKVLERFRQPCLLEGQCP